MELQTIHAEAMDLAEKALVDRSRGRLAEAKKHLAAAFRKERAAAELAIRMNIPEPTRSILLKSAAHLAVDTGELRIAEQLIGKALGGEPPDDLAHELRSLFEEINFHRHLELRGIELSDNDAQLVLAGNAIAPGMAAADEFTGRLTTIERLVQRTSEHDRSIKYREQGAPTHAVARSLKLFVGLPRAASYAVSIRVAENGEQSEFDFAESSQVLNLVVDRLEMYDREDFSELRKAIPDKQYYDNFVQLAAALAPDGDRVRLVGLTTIRGGSERRLEMLRPSQGNGTTDGFVKSDEQRQLSGRVFFINTKDQENPVIKLEADDGNDYRLKADGDLLQKAVRYAAKETRVKVSGVQVTKTMIQVNEFKAHRERKPKAKGLKKRR